MDGARGEGGQADRDVLGTALARGAVAYPLPGPGMRGLAGLDGQLTALELDHHGTVQDDGELIELRALARLGPAGRAAHPGDAQPGVTRAGPAHELVDQLRRLAGGGHP